MKKFISWTIFMLLFIAMFSLGINIKLVKSESKTIVVPDHYATIQEAVNAASNGDTIFVKSGTYYEHVVVNKTVSLVGENKSTTIIDGKGMAYVINVTANKVNISEFTIRNADTGLYLWHSGGHNISYNTITNNSQCGIHLRTSTGCIIANNWVENNGNGIELKDYSSGNTIINNTVINNSADGIIIWWYSTSIVEKNLVKNNNGEGVLVYRSSYTKITGNIVINNSGMGIWVRHSDYPIISNNTVVHNGIDGISVSLAYYPATVSNNEVRGNGRAGIYSYISNCYVERNNVTGNRGEGIIFYASGGYITNNIVQRNVKGIYLSFSQYLSLTNNTLNQNVYNFGVYGADLNEFIHNIDQSNIVNGKPIYYLINKNSLVIDSTNIGFLALVNCTSILVQNLNLTNNLQGILLANTKNSTICNNNFSDNLYGIYIRDSNGNFIYHNNFINNAYQVYDMGWLKAHLGEAPLPSLNTWDDGYPSGGNYWSDYTDVDADGDGIGDTPYVIDENNQDNYPLMEPWTPIEVINATIDVDSYTLNLKSKGKWIIAYIELPEGYNVGDINVSSILLNDTIPVDLSEPIAIGDYDNDTVLDLMVCFNWTEVAEYILFKGIVFGNITLEVSGKLYDGTVFIGTDIVLVSSLIGDVNIDGKVDIEDICKAAMAFGSYPAHPRWNPNADFTKDSYIGIDDICLTARNFGKQA